MTIPSVELSEERDRLSNLLSSCINSKVNRLKLLKLFESLFHQLNSYIDYHEARKCQEIFRRVVGFLKPGLEEVKDPQSSEITLATNRIIKASSIIMNSSDPTSLHPSILNDCSNESVICATILAPPNADRPFVLQPTCRDLMYLHVMMNGVPLLGMLDTGASANFLTLAMAKLMGVHIHQSKKSIPVTLGNGKTESYSYEAKVSIKFKDFESEQTFYIDDGPFQGLHPLCVIFGKPLFTAFHLIIDVAGEQLFSMKCKKDIRRLINYAREMLNNEEYVFDRPEHRFPPVEEPSNAPLAQTQSSAQVVTQTTVASQPTERNVTFRSDGSSPLTFPNSLPLLTRGGTGTKHVIQYPAHENADHSISKALLQIDDPNTLVDVISAIALNKDSDNYPVVHDEDEDQIESELQYREAVWRAAFDDDDYEGHAVTCCDIFGDDDHECRVLGGSEVKAPHVTTTESVNDSKQHNYTFNIANHLSESEKEQLGELLNAHHHLFCDDPVKLTRANYPPIKIDYNDPLKPVFRRNFRMGPAETKALERRITKMAQAGVYEPSTSNFCSPCFMVPKDPPPHVDLKSLSDIEYEEACLREVIDYKEINDQMKDVRYTLPFAASFRDWIASAKYFSIIDVKNGFLQFGITPESRPPLAFSVNNMLFQPCTLPFGMKTSPSYFQKAMDDIYQPYLRQFIHNYMDDGLCFSDSFEDHLDHIRKLFKLYEKYNIQLNPMKCVWGERTVKYLGQILSPDGIKPDPKKINGIRDIRSPKTIAQLRRFLGMINYHSKFIENYAILCAPLNDLLTKDAIFAWTETQEIAFIALKDALTSAPFLVHFDPTKKHIVSTDASDYQIAGILKQVEMNDDGSMDIRVVEYFSLRLKNAQLRYHSVEKEFFAVYKSVINWDHWLFLRHFVIETDNKTICCYKSIGRSKAKTPVHSRRLVKWRIKLDEYDFDMVHKPGKDNVDADWLSRAKTIQEGDDEDKQNDDALAMYAALLVSDPDSHFRYLQLNDPFCKAIIDSLTDPKTSTKELDQLSKQYDFRSGILRKIMIDPRTKRPHFPVVLPDSLQLEVIQQAHDHLFTGGHTGYAKSLSKICGDFWFPKMHDKILRYITSCEACCRAKPKIRGTGKGQSVIFEFDGKPLHPFDMVAIDAMVFENVPSGHFRYAIVCVDLLTGFVICRPVANLRYSNIQKFFTDHVFQFGIPSYVISDNATSFKNVRLDQFCNKLGIGQRYSTEYHPQGNGMAERAVRTFKSMATAYCESNKKLWPKVLPAVELAYNIAVKKGSKYSPYFLLFGHNGNLGLANQFEIPSGFQPLQALTDPQKSSETIQEFLVRIKGIRDEAKRNLIESKRKWKSEYDRSRTVSTFSPGDKVVKKLHRRPAGQSKAFTFRYSAPFTVTRVINPLCVELIDESGEGRHNCHVDFLKLLPVRREDLILMKLERMQSDYALGRYYPEELIHDDEILEYLVDDESDETRDLNQLYELEEIVNTRDVDELDEDNHLLTPDGSQNEEEDDPSDQESNVSVSPTPLMKTRQQLKQRK